MSDITFQEEAPKRPVLLTVLSILSLITMGFGALGNLFSWISGPSSEEVMYEQKVEFAKAKTDMLDVGADGFATFFDKMYAMLEQTNQSFVLSQLISTLMLTIGIVGVVFMLKQRRLGFHLYIVYSLIGVGGIFLYVSPSDVPTFLTIVNAIFAGLFIFLYSRTLHWMTK